MTDTTERLRLAGAQIDMLQRELSEVRAALDALGRAVGQALVVRTLAPGESLSGPAEHAIVQAMLDERAERAVERRDRADAAKAYGDAIAAERAALGEAADDKAFALEVLENSWRANEASVLRQMAAERAAHEQTRDAMLRAQQALLALPLAQAELRLTLGDLEQTRRAMATMLIGMVGRKPQWVADLTPAPVHHLVDEHGSKNVGKCDRCGATAPLKGARGIGDCPIIDVCDWGCSPKEATLPAPCTPEERAVLDAMASIDVGVLEHIEKGWSAAHPVWHPPALAEFARRAAKGGNGG